MKGKKIQENADIISLENFDPRGPRNQVINSPRSLAVCQFFSINPSELFLLEKKELFKALGRENISGKEKEEMYVEYLTNMQDTLESLFEKRQEIVKTGILPKRKTKKTRAVSSKKKTRAEGVENGHDKGIIQENHKIEGVKRIRNSDNIEFEQQGDIQRKPITNQKRNPIKRNSKRIDSESGEASGKAIGENRPIIIDHNENFQSGMEPKILKKTGNGKKRRVSLSTPKSNQDRRLESYQFNSTYIPNRNRNELSLEHSTMSKLQRVQEREERRQMIKIESYKIMQENRQQLVQKMQLADWRHQNHLKEKEGTPNFMQMRDKGEFKNS